MSETNVTTLRPKAKDRTATERTPMRRSPRSTGSARGLILMMVLCCDPLAIALTAAVSARRSCST
jgi:hypothetical protein